MSANRWLRAALGALLLLGAAPALAHGEGDHADVSDDPHWALLAKVAVSQAPPDYQYRARIPADVLALAGEDLTIGGYAVLLGQDAESDHFLLSRSSPDCPYHAAARPNEVIEVHLAKAERLPLGREIRVTGRFGLEQNGHAGLFFRLEGGGRP